MPSLSITIFLNIFPPSARRPAALRALCWASAPRGAISLMRVAKGFAALSGRAYVTPDDVKAAALPTLPHRLTLTGAARIRKNAAEAMIAELIGKVTVPTESELGWSRG